MRFGYVAFATLVIRAGMLEGQDWLAWLEPLNGLPPPRFVLSIFAAIVLLARLMLVFSAPKVTLAVKGLKGAIYKSSHLYALPLIIVKFPVWFIEYNQF